MWRRGRTSRSCQSQAVGWPADAQRSRRAEDSSDVRVVDEVLEDHDAARTGQYVLETRLHHYMTANKNIALRRVNIGRWDNDAAKQATREFRAEALPYIRVYDAKGKFVADVTGVVGVHPGRELQQAERGDDRRIQHD